MRYVFSLYAISVLAAAVWPGKDCLSQNQNLNKAVSYFEDYEQYNVQASLPMAKEKIDLAAAGEGTKDKFKTWHYKGKIYLALFDVQLKEEMKKSTAPDNTKKLMAAYLNTSADLLEESYNAFQKEIELDEKKIYTGEAIAKQRVIANIFGDKAYSSLVVLNYPDALKYYERSYEIKLKMNVTDTVLINNMAIAATKAKEYKKAEQYHTKLIEMKYNPEKNYLAMIQLFYDARTAQDTAHAKAIITKAADEFPENYALLIEKLNICLKENRSEEAIAAINKALVKNPDNHELHLVLGQTYNKMAFPKDAAGKELARPGTFNDLINKAEEELNKTIRLKSDYFVGHYTLGIFYYNLGIDILKQSEASKDPKTIKAEEAKADVFFNKAIPILEKAHELDRTDRDVMKTLSQLYARTGQADSEKYKKLSEELKGGK